MSKKLLSIKEMHDYITLTTPNGNFTVSFSGAKGSGRIAEHLSVFDKYIQTKIKEPGMNYGLAMKTLLDENVMTSLWPDWNKNFVDEDLIIGARVKVKPPFNKKNPLSGKLEEIKRKYGYIRFDNGDIIGFELSYITKDVTAAPTVPRPDGGMIEESVEKQTAKIATPNNKPFSIPLAGKRR